MDTPMTLAARLRAAREAEDYGDLVSAAREAEDYLDRLSAPDVEVGLTRYTPWLETDDIAGMTPDTEGEWVRHEDVAALIAAARAVPADVVLETTAEERAEWIARVSDGLSPVWGQCRRAALDVNTLTAALAASTAQEKAKDEEIAGLEAALKAYDTLSLVISSAVREAQPSYRDQLSVAIKSARAALSGRKPDKEGT